jgi:hypothetical protein
VDANNNNNALPEFNWKQLDVLVVENTVSSENQRTVKMVMVLLKQIGVNSFTANSAMEVW